MRNSRSILECIYKLRGTDYINTVDYLARGLASLPRLYHGRQSVGGWDERWHWAGAGYSGAVWARPAPPGSSPLPAVPRGLLTTALHGRVVCVWAGAGRAVSVASDARPGSVCVSPQGPAADHQLPRPGRSARRWHVVIPTADAALAASRRYRVRRRLDRPFPHWRRSRTRITCLSGIDLTSLQAENCNGVREKKN